MTMSITCWAWRPPVSDDGEELIAVALTPGARIQTEKTLSGGHRYALACANLAPASLGLAHARDRAQVVEAMAENPMAGRRQPMGRGRSSAGSASIHLRASRRAIAP